jgi:hypothetical protein
MRKPKSTHMGVVARAGLVVLTLVAAMFIGVAPASAHDSKLCSNMPTGARNVVKYGGILQLDNVSHSHDISWTFAQYDTCAGSFPSGGRIEVAVQFRKRGTSGCLNQTHPSEPDGAWKLYDAKESHTLATDVSGTTCYRLKWRATNDAAANRSTQGTIRAVD